MDANDNDSEKELRLKAALETEDFQRLLTLAKTLRDNQKHRAMRVLEAFLAGNEVVDPEDPSDTASIAAGQWAQFMNETIVQNLDSRSIGHFVELVLQFHVRTSQAAKANKRHEENRALKAEVFSCCDDHMRDFKSMDSAAEAIAGKLVPVKFRTARDWIGEWKKLRSAGTP